MFMFNKSANAKSPITHSDYIALHSYYTAVQLKIHWTFVRAACLLLRSPWIGSPVGESFVAYSASPLSHHP